MADQGAHDAGTDARATPPAPVLAPASSTTPEAAPTTQATPVAALQYQTDPPTITIPVVLPLKEHARVWMVLAGVLGIMLVASLVIIGYLWNVNGKWQAQVESLTDTGYSLGDRVAEHRQQIAQLEATNALLTDQLSAAKDTVLTLSDEKAQWSDETAYAEQQVDLLVNQVSTSQDVIAQLGRCIEGEQQLVAYIDAGEAYPPAQVEQYRVSVDQLCATAAAAVTDFQRSLTE